MLNSRNCSAVLIVALASLLSMGIIAIYSTTFSVASNTFLIKQLFFVGVGLTLMLVETYIPMEQLSKAIKWILLCVCLVLAYLALGNVIYKLTGNKHPLPGVTLRNGAMRWLKLGPLTLQPAEFAKFALILFLANYYGTRDARSIDSMMEGCIIPFSVVLFVLGLIALGRSMSNTVVTSIISMLTMYFSGVKLRKLATFVVLLLILGGVLILVTPFRRQRIASYFRNEKSSIVLGASRKQDDKYQLNRSVCAIGSGGAGGLGIGRGRLKHRLIPESKTDFIFSVIGEEMGFRGITICLLLYLAINYCCLGIARQCHDKRNMLLCLAIGMFIPLQALLNLGVVCGLFPTTGVTAPLVSYGGSSLLSMLMCLGLVFNAGRQNCLDSQKEEQELMEEERIMLLSPQALSNEKRNSDTEL